MPTTLPAGPFETFPLGNGEFAPLYLIPFDKRGHCKAPKTRRHLLDAAGGGGFSHVFLFSHGWNNDFPTALARYRSFIGSFQAVRETHGAPQPYKPLLIGVLWPSTILVLPGERPPRMAAIPGDAVLDQALDVEDDLAELDEIAALLPEAQLERFYSLAGSAKPLGEGEALELAAILQPLYASPEDPGAGPEEAPGAEELVAAWRATAEILAGAGAAAALDDDEESFGAAAGLGTGAGVPALRPDAAGLRDLDPRGAVRAFTVWKMKDRAGKVGAAGVGALLADVIAAAPAAAKHLVGHSYGAKVVLSAANALPAGNDGALTSILLLQPAINGWAFAANVAGKGFAGGYRRVLGLVEQPVLSTFSRHDAPLTKLFHLAVRRKGDLGEIRAAAVAPSRYAALGGFGPQGVAAPEGREVPMPASGTAYPAFDAATRVVGLRGDAVIGGHGDVATSHTAWALYHQVRAGGP